MGWCRDGSGEKTGAKDVEAWSKEADDAIVVVFVPWVCVAVEK